MSEGTLLDEFAAEAEKVATLLNEVKLNGQCYSLRRIKNKEGVENDGFGDSGRMFNCINFDIDEITHGEIKVGCSVQCGSLLARSFGWQDWVVTTPVTEIVRVNEDRTEVEFKTQNSTYIAKAW